jgi:hypothetical protein
VAAGLGVFFLPENWRWPISQEGSMTTFMLVLVVGHVVMIEPDYGTKEACEAAARVYLSRNDWPPEIKRREFACVFVSGPHGGAATLQGL